MRSENTSKQDMSLELPIKIMSYDTDYMQIVHNVVYVRWFEDLRTAMLDKYFPLEEMLKENNTPILAETNVKYKRPLTLKNKPTGRIWVEELTRSKWVVCIEIVENGKVYCEGKQSGYYYNMDSNRPVRIPEKFVTHFNGLDDD